MLRAPHPSSVGNAGAAGSCLQVSGIELRRLDEQYMPVSLSNSAVGLLLPSFPTSGKNF
ncbi:MAG: hypothetical protein KME26_02095 [Oscillatoria princeps RMCB-10]|nr:hypothetical protein [Oscillatoria princeps RMCB-10]